MSALSHLVRLEEVASFMGGSTPSRARAQYFGGGIPWVKTTDLNNGLISTTEETLTELGLQESSCKMIPANAVLVAMYGGFNQIGRTGLLLNDSAINQALTAIIPDERKLDAAFLLEWLNFRVDYWKRFAGSSRKDPNITKGDVADFPVPSTPVDQQRDASRVLAEWNQAIEKTERLIAAKEKRLESATTKLYALSNRRGTHSHFGSFLKESSVTGANGLHARKLSIKLYGKGVVPKDEKRTGSEQTQYFVRRTGQLVYSKLDFLNGAFGIVPAELNGYESTLDLPAFDIDDSVVDPAWLLGYLTRPVYYTRQIGLARGQRKARRVHPSDFLASSLRLPPLEMQGEIAAALQAMKKDIETTAGLLAAFKIQKRGLMQKLLTGQWRLNEHKEVSHG